MRNRMHRVPLRYIQKLGCVLLNRYFSEPSRGFSKGSHALAEAGREASATSEEAALRGGAEKARYAAARRPSQRRRAGSPLRSRFAVLRGSIVGRARRAIGNRGVDPHIPGQHQIGHEHGQDMLDAVRHGADERDIAVKLEELVVIEGLHMHAHRRNSISPVSGFMDCTMASDSK